MPGPGPSRPRRELCGASQADQVALWIGEVADHQAGRRLDRAHLALPAQALGPLQRRLDVGDADVEDHVAVVRGASADAAGNPGSVAGRAAVHEPVVRWLRHRLRDRGAHVELPAEQVTEVAPELLRVLANDLEVHDRLGHGCSFRAGLPGARGADPSTGDWGSELNSSVTGRPRAWTAEPTAGQDRGVRGQAGRWSAARADRTGSGTGTGLRVRASTYTCTNWPAARGRGSSSL